MSKGDKVKVIKGKNKGAVGEVFFNGTTQYGDRIGLKTADGEKVWVNPDAVVPDAPAPVAAPMNLRAMAAALDGAPAPAAPAGDAVTALTARVAGLELLVGKLLDRVAALEGAAPDDGVRYEVKDGEDIPDDLFDPPFLYDEPPPPYGES